MSISSRSIKISSKTMACVSLRSSLRILWTAVAALVFLTRSSAAPTFGGADKAMVGAHARHARRKRTPTFSTRATATVLRALLLIVHGSVTII
uniref:SFRICE_003166 n=1 Tax=Spodoptera frugiperda TaxID=7108 RepID=A0A2H1W2I7_SPOFR